MGTQQSDKDYTKFDLSKIVEEDSKDLTESRQKEDDPEAELP